MPFPNPPAKIVPFNVGAVAPHDIGRQFDEHRRGIREVIDFLRTLVREDGKLVNGLVGPEQLDPKMPELLAKQALLAVQDVLSAAHRSAQEAQAAADQTERLRDQIHRLEQQIEGSADAMAKATEEFRDHLKRLDLEGYGQTREGAYVTDTVPTGVLGPQKSNFYATDEEGSAPLASDYAQVAIEWAEHLPDPIPPNILAINAITGEHWSARWWASQAAGAFGQLAWWYMGAWPQPGPPTTPYDPTGKPIPPGAMYWDTDLQKMMVWNGSAWVNSTSPAPAVVQSLYYVVPSGTQSVFPLTTPDRFGKNFAFNATDPEGLSVYKNGIRLEPTNDYSLNPATSTVTMVVALTAGQEVIFDILKPTNALRPAGSANTLLVAPITPNGSTTSFTLSLAVGGAVNASKSEELLVSVEGVIQQPGVAYTASGANITFSEAPAANAVVYMVWFGPPVTVGGSGTVSSVAGRTGDIVLIHTDIADWTATLAPYAPKASPALTGVPTAPTAAPATSTTQIATTAFVTTAVGSGVGPGTGATVTIADTAPSSPAAGSMWFDSVAAQMYLRFDDGSSQQWVPVVNQINAFNGGTVNGPVDLLTQVIGGSGAVTINRISGENVILAPSGSITSLTITGWPAGGMTGKVRLQINNFGGATIAWPTGTIWPGGVAPTLSASGKKDIILLMTDNAGITVFGSVVGQDYR